MPEFGMATRVNRAYDERDNAYDERDKVYRVPPERHEPSQAHLHERPPHVAPAPAL